MSEQIVSRLNLLNMPLVPKDFSHSFFTLSRSQSSSRCLGDESSCGRVIGSDTGSPAWTPIKDTLKFFTWMWSCCGNLFAMTESSFGLLHSVKDGSGADISASPAVGTSFTFTGREWDSEIDLYYYRARYYNANIGRFIQSDPEPGRVVDPITVNNKYTYVGNSPLNRIDPMGTDFWGDLGRGIAFIAVAVVTFGVGALAGAWAVGQIGIASLGASVAASIGAAIVGGIVGGAVGAFVGGAVGAIMFPAFGLGTAKEGFAFGAAIGGIGGALAGSGLMKTPFSFEQKALEFTKPQYSGAEPWFKTFMTYSELTYNIVKFTVPSIYAVDALLKCDNSNLSNCNANHEVKDVTGRY